jgi:hypothetical protein
MFSLDDMLRFFADREDEPSLGEQIFFQRNRGREKLLLFEIWRGPK